MHALVDRAEEGTKVRIIQTNSAGDNVHVIDPVTNKVVGVIEGIEVNHGAGVAPDGSRIYISDEAESTLDIVDAKTLKVIKKIPLSGHPNNMAVGKDGKRVYVGIAQAPGGVDVIDTASMKNVKTRRDEGPDPQRLRHPGRQVRGGGQHSRQDDQRDRRVDRRAGLDARDGPGHPADDVQRESRRLDEVDLRAVDRFQRVCGRSISRPARRSSASRTRICRRESRRCPKDPIRLTAWR